MAAHVPTEEQRQAVRIMATAGCMFITIAQRIGVSEATLYKHYQDELDYGSDFVRAELVGVTYQRAIHGDCVASTFFLLKTRFGFRETNRTEVVETKDHKLEGVDYDNMSKEDRAALRGILERNIKKDEAQEKVPAKRARPHGAPPAQPPPKRNGNRTAPSPQAQ